MYIQSHIIVFFFVKFLEFEFYDFNFVSLIYFEKKCFYISFNFYINLFHIIKIVIKLQVYY